MDATTALAVLQVALGITLTASAAMSDVRTRHATDPHWAVLCALAPPVASYLLRIDYGTVPALCYLAGSWLLAWYMLSQRLVGWRAAPVVAVGTVLMASCALAGDIGPLMSAVLFLAFAGMYRAGLLPGGADAKCLMTLALVFPHVPEVPWLPLLWDHSGIPIVLPVTVLALLMSLLAVVPVLVRNLRSGYRGRGMLTSMDVDVRTAEPDFLWPVQKLVNGELVDCRASGRTAPGILTDLREAGIERVRATPTVPFLLPVFVSLAIVVVVGDPFGALCRGRTRS